MNKNFSDLVKELVAKCNGNQAEAGRRAGVAISLINDTMNGKGPIDPRTETWERVYKALGKKGDLALVKEHRAQYFVNDRFESLTDFIRSTDPEKQEVFFTLAKSFGWREEGKQIAAG